MEFSQEDYNELPLIKFESMLKTNRVLFFDSSEFESIIHHYLNQGKFALAKKAIKLGLEQHPSSTNLKLFKIEVYIFEDKLDVATKLLNELYVLEPGNEEIYIQKANILSKQDQHELAINTLKKAAELTSENADIYSLIGMEYLFLDKFNDAKHYFIKCLDSDIEDYTALYNIIYCFDFLEQNEEAIAYLNLYIDKNPYSEVAWHQLGKQYVNQNQYKQALSAFEFAIISDDTFIGAYLEKGKVLEQLSQYHEAIENYAITLELDDPTSFALLRIGLCYEKLGNNELAEHYFFKTVEEDPLLDKGWIAITKFFNRQKNYKKALYYINKAINIDSENVLYWKLYAKINHRLEYFEETEHGLKKALELGNYELETWLLRCDVLLKLDEAKAAIKNLHQAAEFYPENAEIEFRLAGLFFKINENRKGIFHLKNAIRFNIEHSIILEELFPDVYTNQFKKLL